MERRFWTGHKISAKRFGFCISFLLISLSHGIFFILLHFLLLFYFIFKIPCPHLHVMCNATQIDAHVNLHVYKCIKVQTILQIQY
ncbi:hypothetical protein N5P37_009241 [Trichoderma harzianum]|nr:hypothetical protein N5P37_009241 [Trichoderma harzianum]